METALGLGVYGFSEAARLTRLRPNRVREWFRGRKAGDERDPLFHGDYEPVEGEYTISFLDLIDVFVAGKLREHGVSLLTLRRVYDLLAVELKTPHPFARKELLSDGKVVFLRGLDERGQHELAEVLTRQKVFPQILLPFLHRIDYDEVTTLAKRWRIANHVVIDPTICFGKPIVEPVGIPTAILTAAYRANDRNAELVGEWYNVHPKHVLAAVEFEDTMAA